MTPREALRGLLAVPYWVAVLVLGLAFAPAVAGWWSLAAAAVIGLVVGVVQVPVLTWLADWMWTRVEILASEWKELQR